MDVVIIVLFIFIIFGEQGRLQNLEQQIFIIQGSKGIRQWPIK